MERIMDQIPQSGAERNKINRERPGTGGIPA